MNDKQAKRRAQIKLLSILLVFLLPVIAAYIIHKNPQWQPSSTKNFGVLVKPAVSLRPFSLRTAEGKTYTLDDMRGKWALIYIGGGHCDQDCLLTLTKARDGRFAQGTEATRINYYYVLTADKYAGDLAALKKEYPGLIMLQGDEKDRQALIAQFRIDKTQNPGSDNRLYLVDPAGTLLLHYPYGFRHIGLMEDLKYLLKWSQLG
jgi:cytochrome oxidase Cu insertion factor (SCO1/SenC/PrrC family)